MKTKYTILLIAVIIIQIFNQQSFSQEVKKNIPDIKTDVIKTDPGEKFITPEHVLLRNKSFTPERKTSIRENQLIDQLKQAKQAGDALEMERIQKELDKVQPSVTQTEPDAGLTKRIYGNSLPGQNINATSIFKTANAKAVTMQKEQIGSSDRMWAIIAYGSTFQDTILTMFSDDNGINWNFYTMSFFYSGGNVNPDEIDAEIVQTPAEKFLYIVCGVTMSTSKKVAGLIPIQISGQGISFSSNYLLLWPSDSYSNLSIKHYRPRITSDAAFYQYGGAWIYIVCCYETFSLGTYTTGQKCARIDNPYTTFPSITYKAMPHFYYTYTNTPQDAYCDLAYYFDGIDHNIIVTESNVPDTSLIYLANSTIFDFTSTSASMGALSDGSGLEKTHGYVSSNGAYGTLMVVNNEKYSTVDYDIQYFKTTNAGLSWSTGFVDYTTNFSQRADIMERKNSTGEFYIAYADYDVFDNVHYCKATGGVWGTIVPQMNHIDASISASPRPCYRSGSEPCFVIWSEYYSTNVWGSGGCSGSVVATKNLNLKMFIQGRYIEPMNHQIGDTVEIVLHNNTSPYAAIDSATSFVGAFGSGSFNFVNPVNGTNYFIVIKHRNSIETWSKSPGQSFSSNVLNYDMTTANSQAFGSNQIIVDNAPLASGIYTADVNQDDIVDLTDLIMISNDANIFLTGYVITDVDGNQAVDLSDLIIAFNNSNAFVTVVQP